MEKDKDYKSWTTEKLKRKANQSWELAGCARQDNDYVDEAKYTADARKYLSLLLER
jgi:hypothetical protein